MHVFILFQCRRFNGLMQLVFCFIYHDASVKCVLKISWKFVTLNL